LLLLLLLLTVLLRTQFVELLGAGTYQAKKGSVNPKNPTKTAAQAQPLLLKPAVLAEVTHSHQCAYNGSISINHTYIQVRAL
jgi:hypothetical protein